ncbi:MAG: DinB family protein [Phycisphaeraceae bacterium]|nr:DinB family protein [Phycisphaerales bacterium]QOJ16852.1 MAG: DinB family protein [Phycisphaeraceae bacterium]
MSATVAAHPNARAVHQVRFARGATKKLLEGIPADRCCEQPGSCVNHALWIAGHLACTDDWFLKEFGGAAGFALPEKWHTIFGYGSKPTSDTSQYPSYAEVLKAMDERHGAVVRWLESMTAEQMDTPTAENWRNYAPTLGDLGHFAAWHEGYHGGQLATLRRGFGLPSAFG